MKLVHPEFFCQIPIVENQVPVLVLETPGRFSDFVSEIRRQCEGGEGNWILSEGGHELKFHKTCEIVIDPFAISLNQRKMIQALYDKIEKMVYNTELLLDWNTVYPFLVQFTEKVIETSEYDLMYREDLLFKDLLKMMNVSFVENSCDLVEKIMDYLALQSEIIGTKVFILCNIKSYLSIQQLDFLYQHAFYKKFHLLLVENHVSSHKNQKEKVIIIDKDDCLIW